MYDNTLGRVDLRRSPWSIHAWVVALISVGYVVIAVNVWSGPHRTQLARAVAQAIVLVMGASVFGFVALATALVAVFARHRHPLLMGYAMTVAIVGTLIATWTLAP